MSRILRQRLEALDDAQRNFLAERLGISTSTTSELVGFIAGKQPPDENALRAFLEDRLPMHMIPRRFQFLNELPRTENGKVDYKDLRSRKLPDHRTTSTAPMNAAERRLARIWCKVLEVPEVNREDNFFDLGGHSLLAMRLFSSIEREFNKALPLTIIFTRPTVAQLADIFQPRVDLKENQSVVTLQAGRDLAPLFCIHAGGGSVFHYRKLAQLLGDDRPVLGIVPFGLDGVSEMHGSVEEMAECYANLMVLSYPTGPYLICGYSFGGSVAYEVSRCLQAMGRDVAYTGLFDTAVFGTFAISDRLPTHRLRLAELNLARKCLYLARSAHGNIRTFFRRQLTKIKNRAR